MNVGELFIKLGITGVDKTRESLVSTKDGLKEVHNSAIAMKAAIVAALYTLERLTASSNATGTNLLNTSAVLGVSTDVLQQYQYAAQQVGISNDSLTGTFKTLQSSMSKIQLGEAPPEKIALISEGLGKGLLEDKNALDEFAKSPQKLLQKLQEYALNTKVPAGFRNEVLKSFGLGDDMIAGLLRGAFNPRVLASAPKYNFNEINSLDENRQKMANLSTKIQMGIGRLNAKHGKEIIEGFDKITTSVLHLADAFTTLAEKVKVFDMIKSALDVVTFMAESTSNGVDLYNNPNKSLNSGKAKAIDDQTDKFLDNHPGIKAFYEFMYGQDKTSELMEAARKAREKAQKGYEVRPGMGPLLKGSVPDKFPPSPDTVVPEAPSWGKKGAFIPSIDQSKWAMGLYGQRGMLNPEFLANASGVVNNTNFNSNQTSSTVSPSVTIHQSNTFQTAENPKEAVDQLTRELKHAYGQMNAQIMGA